MRARAHTRTHTHTLTNTQWCPQATRGLPHANMVWALSVWQSPPPPDWLSLLCSHATPHLPGMSATSCAVLLTGLADLGHRPPIVSGCVLAVWVWV